MGAETPASAGLAWAMAGMAGNGGRYLAIIALYGRLFLWYGSAIGDGWRIKKYLSEADMDAHALEWTSTAEANDGMALVVGPVRFKEFPGPFHYAVASTRLALGAATALDDEANELGLSDLTDALHKAFARARVDGVELR